MKWRVEESVGLKGRVEERVGLKEKLEESVGLKESLQRVRRRGKRDREHYRLSRSDNGTA